MVILCGLYIFLEPLEQAAFPEGLCPVQMAGRHVRFESDSRKPCVSSFLSQSPLLPSDLTKFSLLSRGLHGHLL